MPLEDGMSNFVKLSTKIKRFFNKKLRKIYYSEFRVYTFF